MESNATENNLVNQSITENCEAKTQDSSIKSARAAVTLHPLVTKILSACQNQQ